jgi:hypothetical protein
MTNQKDHATVGSKSENANAKRIVKARIFLHWLHFRLFPDEYGIFETIDHGMKMVKLGVELKNSK